ncbi:MAG TPA: DUF4160 domain-containing protein, partial [Thermoanaerobaculia bacterium]|nr:DUF4160 domain-containing protein [Thermoanaerobaculia bacterium]
REPRHVRVERDDSEAKFWLGPVRLEESSGFAASELAKIEGIIENHKEDLREAWDDFFTD